MLGITRRDFINYSVKPGIIPRVKTLFISGFQLVPFFMALVYQAVRLLPPNHPYTNPNNVGKFGIRHVVAEAASRLVFSTKNIDQIVLFFALLMGLIIVVVQIMMLGVYLFSGTAFATTTIPTSFSGFFLLLPANRPHDLAYMFFDLIFGIPNAGPTPLFGSCINPSVGVACITQDGTPMSGPMGGIVSSLGWPMPIHQGLHMMFYVYNTGLLVVAALILCYFIATIVMETAQTGTAFGKRFNKVWAPLRIVFAFGLLIPFSIGAGGLNSAQYIVLYAAKFGSSFASNGWALFINVIGTGPGQNPLVNTLNLVSEPTPPEVSGLLQFMFAARVCQELEWYTSNITPLFDPLANQTTEDPVTSVRMYAVKDNLSTTPALPILRTTTYSEIITFAAGDRQVIFRFGIEDPVNNASERGHVGKLCGELIMPLVDPRQPGRYGDPAPPATGPFPAENAVTSVQAHYFSIVQELWYNVYRGWNVAGGSGYITPYLGRNYPRNMVNYYSKWGQDPAQFLPPPEYKRDIQEFYSADITYGLKNGGPGSVLDPAMAAAAPNGAKDAAVNSYRWNSTIELRNKGWAGAGTFYGRIAEVNGVLTAATLNIPGASLYPALMEDVRKRRSQQNASISYAERFKPELAFGQDVPTQRPPDAQKQAVLWEAFHYWQVGSGVSTSHTATRNNPVLDFINALFGTSGLYSMRMNANVHPLAQLVGVGRSLIEAATRNIGLGAGATMLGMSLDGAFAGLAGVGASMMYTIAMVALSAGFILFYVVPLLPFIYFFFAVGGWFKAIFEAMVGAPLWALAHIRIDGPGLSGQAAVAGYFLILEIFLRPILIIFGLLASTSIFAAMVNVLNQTWDLVVANLTGFDVQTELCVTGGIAPCGGTPTLPAGTSSMINFFRGPIDRFFFTVIYAVVVYLLGMTCFKLVDIIPSNILRWMGQSVATFSDQREDAGQNLAGTATIGIQQATTQLGGALQKSSDQLMKAKG